MSDDTRGRQLLPIPDAQHVGLTTYDAKDPDTSFPPITPLRPPAGAPNVLVILLDDAGFRLVVDVRRAGQHAELRPSRRRVGCATPGSTPPRCARRPGRLC